LAEWLKERVRLGKTDLKTGRLGLGASYIASKSAWEAAFQAGCNLFYYGALRTPPMAKAIRHLVAEGRRDEMVIVLQSHMRSPRLLEKSFLRGLKRLRIDKADILLLGQHSRLPNLMIMDKVQELREKKLFRYLALSSHHRPLFKDLAKDQRFDLFWLRYNAAHRGAEEDVFPHLPEDRPGVVVFTATRMMTLVRSRKIPKNEKKPAAGDCYRFVLTHPKVDAVITGPFRKKHMMENLQETGKGPMSEEELEWMRRIGDYVCGGSRGS
jgi:aryl-alcohol dehydrogenase-like predicted oxidoreductase